MSILLQIVQGGAAVAETVAETTTEGGGMDIFSLIWKGGIVMIPIGILGVIAVYLSIERYLTIKKASVLDSQFMGNIKSMVTEGDLKGAQRLCVTNGTPIGLMIDKGLSRIGKPLKDISVAVENVGKLEVYKLEKGMALLATISGAAPMLGFLGTVTGMIRTFHNISISNKIDISTIAGGIYEKMVTSASGLIVGIIAYVLYTLLTTMIDRTINKMEITAIDFLDILHKPASKA